MTRLQTEHRRLYQPPATEATQARGLLGPGGQVRALVLALRGPADWGTLAPVWQGVQADLGWPAPAIAVNGRDAFELWFSLADPLPRAEAAELLAQLQRRYLADVRPERVRAWPGADVATEPPACPPFAAGPERWAAFVTPDLPAVFGDDPALDFRPGADAQAELLSRLASITPDKWRAALLRPAAPPAAAVTTAPAGSEPAPPSATPGTTHAALVGPYQNPQRFLLDVMNDPTVALALRIEAAKALLPHGAPGAPAGAV